MQPNLVLLDLMMPSVDGRQVIEAIRANPAHRHLPIVVITAAFGLMRESSYGVQGYIAKPMDALEMLRVIEDVLRQ
jgi:two-component system response regulator